MYIKSQRITYSHQALIGNIRPTFRLADNTDLGIFLEENPAGMLTSLASSREDPGLYLGNLMIWWWLCFKFLPVVQDKYKSFDLSFLITKGK